MNAPPPLHAARKFLSRRAKTLIAIGCVPAFLFIVLVALRLFGVVHPFYVPTGAMTPEISPGDRLLMLRLLFRQPHRGDIVVFNTADIVGLPEDQFYVKRVVGEPGEQVRIADGKLYINGAVVTLSNRFGNIEYLPPIGTMIPPHTEMKIPSGAYFVVGDNSTNSYDSRYYGCVPRANIKGRIILCYWPLDKFGRVQ